MEEFESARRFEDTLWEVGGKAALIDAPRDVARNRFQAPRKRNGAGEPYRG